MIHRSGLSGPVEAHALLWLLTLIDVVAKLASKQKRFSSGIIALVPTSGEYDTQNCEYASQYWRLSISLRWRYVFENVDRDASEEDSQLE